MSKLWRRFVWWFRYWVLGYEIFVATDSGFGIDCSVSLILRKDRKTGIVTVIDEAT